MPDHQTRWYAVRCIFDIDRPEGTPHLYEERITLWETTDLDAAITLAQAEAEEYADSDAVRYAGLAQGYELFDPPGHGGEVFSLMRPSELPPEAYLDRFFDTGSERTQDS